MKTFDLVRVIKEALLDHPEVERVETVAEHEARQRRAAEDDPGLLLPPPRPRRSSVPEDALWVTCADQGEFFVKVTRFLDAAKDEFEEGDPPWKRPQ